MKLIEFDSSVKGLILDRSDVVVTKPDIQSDPFNYSVLETVLVPKI